MSLVLDYHMEICVCRELQSLLKFLIMFFLTSLSSIICKNYDTIASFPSVAVNAHKGSSIRSDAKNPSTRLLNSLGKLKDIKFMSIFRFKIWGATML